MRREHRVERGHFLPASFPVRAAATIPQARLIEMEGGHLLPIEQPLAIVPYSAHSWNLGALSRRPIPAQSNDLKLGLAVAGRARSASSNTQHHEPGELLTA